jgi:hypothetical protein
MADSLEIASYDRVGYHTRAVFYLFQSSEPCVIETLAGEALSRHYFRRPSGLPGLVQPPRDQRVLLVHGDERVGVIALHVGEGVVHITVVGLIGHLYTTVYRRWGIEWEICYQSEIWDYKYIIRNSLVIS